MTDYLNFPANPLGSVVVNLQLFPNHNDVDLCVNEIFRKLSEVSGEISQTKNNEICSAMLKSVRDQIHDALDNEVGFRTEFREAVVHGLIGLIENYDKPKPTFLRRLFHP